MMGSTMPNDGYFEVLWPRSPRMNKAKTLAPRLETLNGKTIAQLWDFVFSGDKVFETIEECIKERYPDVRFVNWREFGNTHGGEERQIIEGLPQRLKELGVDGAISGIGA